MATASITLENYFPQYPVVEHQTVHTSDTGFWFCRPSKNVTGSFDYVSGCLLDAGIEIDDWSSLSSFVKNNPEVSPILIKLPSVASRIFEGNFHSMSLEVFTDFEDEYKNEELFLKINTSLSPEEANAFLFLLNRHLISLGIEAVKINTSLNYV